MDALLYGTYVGWLLMTALAGRINDFQLGYAWFVSAMELEYGREVLRQGRAGGNMEIA